VQILVERSKTGAFDEPVAAQLALIVRARAEEIHYLMRKANQLSSELQAQEPEFVLCHSDIHADNLLIDPTGRLYIVDWDNPILAPKERDLMFVGGGVGSSRSLFSPDDVISKQSTSVGIGRR
jgi:spectinomycin phosphotransferase